MDLMDMRDVPASDIRPSPRGSFWNPRFKLPTSGMMLEMEAYGQPQYKVTPTTRAIRQQVFPRSGYSDYGHLDPIPDVVTLPVGFKPASGTDSQADVWVDPGLDPRLPNGGWVSFWGYMDYAIAKAANPAWQFWGNIEWQRQQLYNLKYASQFDTWDAVAGTVCRVHADQEGNAGFYTPARPIFTGVATADEVEAGEIPHYLTFTTTMIMGGPAAPRSILDVNDERIGTEFKAACAPARLIEATEANLIAKGRPIPPVTSGIMMGSLWRADPTIWTPTRHRAWVASKPTAQQHAADTFGRCLVQWGIGPDQSGPYNMVILDSSQKKRYVAAGVTKNLLVDFGWDSMVMLDPVWAEYTNGSEGNREGDIAKFAHRAA